MEKVSLVLEYRAQGMSFEDCLSITGITRNQFYHKPKGNKQGKPLSKDTKWRNPNTNQRRRKSSRLLQTHMCSLVPERVLYKSQESVSPYAGT